MEVWVLEWSYPYDGETNVTIWASQVDAQKQALKEINELIDDWDMDDQDASSCAEDIADMTKRGHYGEALQRFHDYQDNYNSDTAQYWHVYERDVLGTDQSEVPTLPPPAPAGYKAPYPGATCRGPCGNFNDYAHADRRDGTYVCRQCSTFQHIFGAKS